MYGRKNPFFNNYSNNQERKLLQNLVDEAISIYGEQIYYVPRKINDLDDLYTADDQSSYEVAIPLVMYIESYDSFQGDGTFMSKMGIEVQDQIIWSVSRTDFSSQVQTITTQVRPNEGDLIFYPRNGRLFQIKYVEKFQVFYQLGGLYTWKLTTELFKYSGEQISTGIPAIDQTQKVNDNNILDWTIVNQDGWLLTNENGQYLTLGYDPASIMPTEVTQTTQQQSDQFVQFDPIDPFTSGNV